MIWVAKDVVHETVFAGGGPLGSKAPIGVLRANSKNARVVRLRLNDT
jgi:hypothetical protein